jgi:hypothetical protein
MQINCNLTKLLRRVEAQKNELRNTNKSQQRQLADKENSSKPDRPNQHIKKKGSTTSVAFDSDELHLIASRFAYMSSLWLRKPKYTFKLDDDPDYNPASRFSSTSSKCQGQFQDLLAAIPAKLHHLMKDESFANSVRYVI